MSTDKPVKVVIPPEVLAEIERTANSPDEAQEILDMIKKAFSPENIEQTLAESEPVTPEMLENDPAVRKAFERFNPEPPELND